MNEIKDQKILVVGPGALGTYLVCRLGHRVQSLWVLDYKSERMAYLQERGFHFLGVSVLDWVPPEGHVRIDLKGLPPMDFIFLTTKAFSIKSVLKKLSKVVSKKTIFVFFQDGGDLKLIRKGIPSKQIIDVCSRELLTMESPGRVRYLSRGEVFLSTSSSRGNDLAAFLSKVGMRIKQSRNISHVRWKKSLILVSLNLVSALGDVTYHRLKEGPLSSLFDEVLSELSKLSRAVGISFSLNEMKRETEWFMEKGPEVVSSFLKDVKLKRQTERTFYVDSLFRVAKQKKVSLPTFSFLNQLMDKVEKL